MHDNDIRTSINRQQIEDLASIIRGAKSFYNQYPEQTFQIFLTFASIDEDTPSNESSEKCKFGFCVLSAAYGHHKKLSPADLYDAINHFLLLAQNDIHKDIENYLMEAMMMPLVSILIKDSFDDDNWTPVEWWIANVLSDDRRLNPDQIAEVILNTDETSFASFPEDIRTL